MTALDPASVSADLIEHAHALFARADEITAAHDELRAARDALAAVWTGPVAEAVIAGADDWIARVHDVAVAVRASADDASAAAAAIDAITARSAQTLAEVAAVDPGRTPEEIAATVDGATLAPAELPLHTREILATLYPDLISPTEGDADALSHACREWVDTVLEPVQEAAQQAERDATAVRDAALTAVLEPDAPEPDTEPVLERAGAL